MWVVQNDTGVITVCAGFFSGTMDEFAVAVESTHGDTIHGITYRAAIQFARDIFAARIAAGAIPLENRKEK